MNGLRLNNRIDRWLGKRSWRLLLSGLPAVFAGLLIFFGVMIVLIYPSHAYYQRYGRLVQGLLMMGRYQEARVACLRGLSSAKTDLDSAEWLYYMAVAMNGLGSKEEAAALVRAAAPLDKPGSLEAQMLMAQTILASTNLSPQGIRSAALNSTNDAAVLLHQAEKHLLNALSLDPNSLTVNEALGRFYINIHQQAKARAHLLKIYSAKPDTALLLAISSDLDTNSAAAIQWADRAISAYEHNFLASAPLYNSQDRLGLLRAMMIKAKYMSGQVPPPEHKIVVSQSAPQDSPDIWLGIVKLLVLNGKYGPALATLEQQMQSSSNSVYAGAIGELCANWAQTFSIMDPTTAAQRLQLLEKGLKYDPNNPAVQFLLIQSADATDATGVAAQDLVDRSLAAAPRPQAAMWEFFISTDARLHRDLPKARDHLQKAWQLDPANPRIENDLAYDTLAGTHADLERGLKVIQSVVEQYPYEAMFVDTRGQILAALGRYPEAAVDLNYSVRQLGNLPDTRQALAKVNAALGIAPEQASPDELLQARQLLHQEKYNEALTYLEKAYRANPNPAYALAMTEVCLANLEHLPVNQSSNRLALIALGLENDPGNQKLQDLLMQASHGPGPAGVAAQKLLYEQVMGASGDTAAQWHLFLGRDARVRGDLVTARKELQTAYAQSPKSLEIPLELARVLAQGNLDDLAEGLKLIQLVVDRFPEDADFVNLRGQILAKLGRNQEASIDLGFAAPRLADARQTRLLLAKVYDALGQPQLAEDQRRQARDARP